MAIDDEDFFATVARHLVGGLLQQSELQVAAIGHGSRLVAGFGDLAKIIFGEDDGIFLLGGVQRGIADVKQVGAQRQMRTMLLKDAEGQQAGSLGTLDAFAKVGRGEFFPMDGELASGRVLSLQDLRQSNDGGEKHNCEDRKEPTAELNHEISLGGEF